MWISNGSSPLPSPQQPAHTLRSLRSCFMRQAIASHSGHRNERSLSCLSSRMEAQTRRASIGGSSSCTVLTFCGPYGCMDMVQLALIELCSSAWDSQRICPGAHRALPGLRLHPAKGCVFKRFAGNDWMRPRLSIFGPWPKFVEETRKFMENAEWPCNSCSAEMTALFTNTKANTKHPKAVCSCGMQPWQTAYCLPKMHYCSKPLFLDE